MIHPCVVQWLAEGCVVQALPTPRGRRNALLLNGGLVTAVLRVSEADYAALIAEELVSKDANEGVSGGSRDAARDNGRGTGSRTSRRPGVGLVSGDDAGPAGSPRT